jgi:hypothetical protein
MLRAPYDDRRTDDPETLRFNSSGSGHDPLFASPHRGYRPQVSIIEVREETVMSVSAWDPWNFRDRETAGSEGRDISGFKVHATDGDIGKVDQASMEVGASQIVVDTGPWIFGRKVLLPAACIERIDWDDEKVHVDRSKDQIKDSPELREGSTWDDPTYRDDVGTYYGNTYGDRPGL